jgi:hypothetical protein
MKKRIVLIVLIGMNFSINAQDETVNGKLTVNGNIESSKILLKDPNTTSDWNSIWQSGFFESSSASNSPESSGWFWGVNFNHRSNNSNYKYNGQIAIKNSPTDPTMYFRSTTQDGTGIWTKLIHSKGNQMMNGNLSVTGNIESSKLSVTGNIESSKILLNDPNTISDWNSIWQSGFFESNNATNSPETSGWFWGANFNHASNNSTYKYNGQIAIKNDHTNPTMYFRSTTQDGTGIWAKIIHNNGNQMINGNFDVNGKIHTKEVKVDLIGWSDFVFENNYNLPTLKEVENHIKEKGHLKDIPSAKEVAENGIFLGEMDSKLLQKIEELTLYTIAQEKKIKELESLNSKFIEILKRLEKLEKK